MKKAISLLLALVLCLSLCACGTKTGTIEITLDNWQQYFEIQEIINWHEDEFGDTSSLWVRYVLCVKAEYADRIVLEESDVAVEYIKYEQTVPVTIDFANKEYVFGNVDKENAFENKGQDRLLKEYDAFLEGYHAVLTSVDPVVFDEYSTRMDENGNQESTCVEFVVNRIKGTIVVKIG